MIGNIIQWTTDIYSVLLIVRWAVEKLLPQYQNTGWYMTIRDATDPLLEAVRKMIPPYKGIDFSYIIGIIGVSLLGRLLNSIL